jgi:hypothetical protein
LPLIGFVTNKPIDKKYYWSKKRERNRIKKHTSTKFFLGI